MKVARYKRTWPGRGGTLHASNHHQFAQGTPLPQNQSTDKEVAQGAPIPQSQSTYHEVTEDEVS